MVKVPEIIGGLSSVFGGERFQTGCKRSISRQVPRLALAG
jgi:hypothetical protein